MKKILSYITIIIFVALFSTQCSLFVGIGDEDREAPKVMISAPVDGAVYSPGTVIISGAASDNDTLQDVYYATNGGAWVLFVNNATTTSSNWQLNLNVSGYKQQMHTISFKAIDSLGGYSVKSTIFYVDYTKPYTSVVGISGNAALGGIITIQTYLTDNLSLKSFKLCTNSLSGTFIDWTSISFGTKSKYIASPNWNLSVYPDGSVKTVIAITVDKVNLTNYVTNTFYVSNLIPIITISNPASGVYVSSNMLINGMAVESNGMSYTRVKVGNSIEYMMNETLSGDGSTNYFSLNLNTKVFTQGDQIVTFRSVAANGSVSIKSTPIVLDYTPPTGTFTSPTNGRSYYGAVNISGTIGDNLGISNASLTIRKTNGSLVQTTALSTSSSDWSINWDTTTLPVGVVNLILTVQDYALNKTVYTNQITIRPYIMNMEDTSTYTGRTSFTNDGVNFGTGVATFYFAGGDTVNGTGGITNRLITIPSSGTIKSGYVRVVVDGITSINSNWLDIWTISQFFAKTGTPETTGRATMYNDKVYFSQGCKVTGNYFTNFLITDFAGAAQRLPGVGNFQGGEKIGVGNAIDVRDNLMVTVSSPKSLKYIRAAIFTNNGTSIFRARTVLVDSTVTLQGSDPLIDVKIDSSKNIHMVYSVYASGKIRYAKSVNMGQTWTNEDAVTGLTFDLTIRDAQASVDVDSAGIPHILYYDYRLGSLCHAWKVGSTWSKEVVDDLGGLNGLYSDIKIDASDTIHASYMNRENGDVMYSSKSSSGSWNRTVADYFAYCGYYTSIDLRGSEVAIGSYEGVYTVARLSYYNGSKWRGVSVPKHTTYTAPYGKYAGVKFNNAGTQIWVGFIDNAQNLVLAKYLKP